MTARLTFLLAVDEAEDKQQIEQKRKVFLLGDHDNRHNAAGCLGGGDEQVQRSQEQEHGGSGVADSPECQRRDCCPQLYDSMDKTLEEDEAVFTDEISLGNQVRLS